MLWKISGKKSKSNFTIKLTNFFAKIHPLSFYKSFEFLGPKEVILHGNDSLGCEKTLPCLNKMHILSFKQLRSRE